MAEVPLLHYDLEELVHETKLLRKTNEDLRELLKSGDAEPAFVESVIAENRAALEDKRSKAEKLCQTMGVPMPDALTNPAEPVVDTANAPRDKPASAIAIGIVL